MAERLLFNNTHIRYSGTNVGCNTQGMCNHTRVGHNRTNVGYNLTYVRYSHIHVIIIPMYTV